LDSAFLLPVQENPVRAEEQVSHFVEARFRRRVPGRERRIDIACPRTRSINCATLLRHHEPMDRNKREEQQPCTEQDQDDQEREVCRADRVRADRAGLVPSYLNLCIPTARHYILEEVRWVR